ncbi:MAG: nucleotidyltransferase family protein [Gemmatimonadetes bacterium]|nr:nucleotidyltransferase family protein [Gemmatimonadota bacterium]
MLAAAILAAGASVRMGQPKPFLKYCGRTFIETIVDAARVLSLRPIVVAIAHDFDNQLRKLKLRDVVLVRNTETQSGPIASIRATVAELLNYRVDGMVLWPVDQPHVAIDTVNRLLDAYRRCDCAIAIPRFQGRRGHPIVLGRAVFPELMSAPSAKSVVRADPARVVEVEVDDPAILEDIDTPEAYRTLVERNLPPDDHRP